MAKERVDRTRKMVRRNYTLAFHVAVASDSPSMNQNHQTAEITSPYTPCTASPYSSSTMTVPIFPHCVCSTNASGEPSFTVVPSRSASSLSTQNTFADPFMLPHVRIDRGAIRFLLAGAHMMCPGLTSAGGLLPPADAAVLAGTPVAFDAEGKEFAVGIGITKMGTEEMKAVNKGVAVESITYVGDDLWASQKL